MTGEKSPLEKENDQVKKNQEKKNDKNFVNCCDYLEKITKRRGFICTSTVWKGLVGQLGKTEMPS